MSSLVAKLKNGIGIRNPNYWLLIFTVICLIGGFLIDDPAGLFRSTYEGSPRLINIQPADITEMRVQTPAHNFLVRRESNGFSLQDAGTGEVFRADEAKVTSFLQKITDLRKFDRVSSSKDRQTALGTDGSFAITLNAGSQTFGLMIGSSGAGYNSTLVRLKDSDDIYGVPGALRSEIETGVDGFRDRKVLSFPDAAVSNISISGAQNFSLSKTGDSWTMPGGEADTAAVQSLLRRLADLRGASFHRERLPVSYGKIVLRLTNGLEQEVSVLGPVDSDYVVTSTVNPAAMRIPRYEAEALFKPASDYARKNNVQPGPPSPQ